MLEGQLEVGMIIMEEEQTTSVYQSSQSTQPILLGHSMEEHTCMELSMRLEVKVTMIMAHFVQFLDTMFHVQCAMHQHEELL